MLDQVQVDTLTRQYDVLGAFKNGPRLWCLDWAEVMVGKERDFMGLPRPAVRVPEHVGRLPAQQDEGWAYAGPEVMAVRSSATSGTPG